MYLTACHCRAVKQGYTHRQKRIGKFSELEILSIFSVERILWQMSDIILFRWIECFIFFPLFRYSYRWHALVEFKSLPWKKRATRWHLILIHEKCTKNHHWVMTYGQRSIPPAVRAMFTGSSPPVPSKDDFGRSVPLQNQALPLINFC